MAPTVADESPSTHDPKFAAVHAIWTDESVGSFLPSLRDDTIESSRLIVTTKLPSVARSVSPRGPPPARPNGVVSKSGVIGLAESIDRLDQTELIRDTGRGASLPTWMSPRSSGPTVDPQPVATCLRQAIDAPNRSTISGAGSTGKISASWNARY